MTRGTLDPRQLGARLRQLREARGLTLKQVHDATGVSVSYLSDLELGKALPSIDVALRLARAYGVTVEELASAERSAEAEGGGAPPWRHGSKTVRVRTAAAHAAAAEIEEAAKRAREIFEREVERIRRKYGLDTQ